MAIVFHYLSGSPFSWKVRLALEHKKINYTLNVLSRDAGDLKKPEFLTINPRGRVPAIVHDKFVLYESAAILEYLEDRFPNAGEPLWPRKMRLRATARRMASEVDSYLYPPVRRMVEELLLRRDGVADEAAIAEAKSLASESLELFAGDARAEFLLGDRPCAADFALYPLTAILVRLNARRPDLELASILPDPLKQWRTRIEGLSYFEKTLPPHWRS